jgi:hypothetical protein
MPLGIEFRRQVRIARSAGADSLRATGLRHEAVDHAMEHDPVVEALADQLLDPLDMFRREVGPQLDHDVPLGGFERQLFSVSHVNPALLVLR